LFVLAIAVIVAILFSGCAVMLVPTSAALDERLVHTGLSGKALHQMSIAEYRSLYLRKDLESPIGGEDFAYYKEEREFIQQILPVRLSEFKSKAMSLITRTVEKSHVMRKRNESLRAVLDEAAAEGGVLKRIDEIYDRRFQN